MAPSSMQEAYDEGFAEGQRVAYEDAARIAEGDDEPDEKFDGNGPEYWGGRSAAAAAIRARAKEGQ